MIADDDGGRPGLREEAEALILKAQQLRLEIGYDQSKSPSLAKGTTNIVSPWLVDDQEKGQDYRLYIDIGREDGTWMDRRWGTSGRRIPFSLDVRFLSKSASEDVVDKMVKDNFGGQSSPPCVLASANAARLRDGFDKMKCHGGGYRIDFARGKFTVRFFIGVDGTTDDQDYGDIFVPKGPLYFSLPCFGGTVDNLSSKEGIVTVRQVGWNTGWRREESRIVGTFRAKPMETARLHDTY